MELIVGPVDRFDTTKPSRDAQPIAQYEASLQAVPQLVRVVVVADVTALSVVVSD